MTSPKLDLGLIEAAQAVTTHLDLDEDATFDEAGR